MVAMAVLVYLLTTIPGTGRRRRASRRKIYSGVIAHEMAKEPDAHKALASLDEFALEKLPPPVPVVSKSPLLGNPDAMCVQIWTMEGNAEAFIVRVFYLGHDERQECWIKPNVEDAAFNHWFAERYVVIPEEFLSAP